jgi:heme-degrading monooxygenase HmoA
MYAVVRRIKVKPHLVGESVQRIEHGLVPLLRKEPGFVHLYIVQVGEGEGLSISVFETKEHTEEGNRKTLEWAKEHIFPLAQGPAEVVGLGEILLHKKKLG